MQMLDVVFMRFTLYNLPPICQPVLVFDLQCPQTAPTSLCKLIWNIAIGIDKARYRAKYHEN